MDEAVDKEIEGAMASAVAVARKTWRAQLLTLWHLLDPGALVLGRFWCSLCQGTTVHIKLSSNEIGVRCLYCKAGAVSRSIIQVLQQVCPDLRNKQVYELSARGPLYDFLSKHAGDLTVSEFFAGAEQGTVRQGIQHQDVQQLTFADRSFDLCTSTDVFEHVVDDRQGFRELCRVLKPGGFLVFTVPLTGTVKTVERARLDATGKVQHLLPAEYHGDPVAPNGRILAWRTYGSDICLRLLDAGFAETSLITPDPDFAWGYKRQVIVARKP